MKTPENDNPLQNQLRLAQLEIKLLREQLLKAPERLHAETKKSAEQTAAPASATNNYHTKSPNDSASDRAPSGNPRVLYVEDSAANFQLVETIFKDRPTTDLLWADTAQKGLAMACAEAPRLILLDLNLPDMHGSELLKRLQAEPATAETPVIVISADATPSQIERMLAAGARNYLTKPFDIRRFLFMVDEVLAAA